MLLYFALSCFFLSSRPLPLPDLFYLVSMWVGAVPPGTPAAAIPIAALSAIDYYGYHAPTWAYISSRC